MSEPVNNIHASLAAKPAAPVVEHTQQDLKLQKEIAEMQADLRTSHKKIFLLGMVGLPAGLITLGVYSLGVMSLIAVPYAIGIAAVSGISFLSVMAARQEISEDVKSLKFFMDQTNDKRKLILKSFLDKNAKHVPVTTTDEEGPVPAIENIERKIETLYSTLARQDKKSLYYSLALMVPLAAMIGFGGLAIAPVLGVASVMSLANALTAAVFSGAFLLSANVFKSDSIADSNILAKNIKELQAQKKNLLDHIALARKNFDFTQTKKYKVFLNRKHQLNRRKSIMNGAIKQTLRNAFTANALEIGLAMPVAGHSPRVMRVTKVEMPQAVIRKNGLMVWKVRVAVALFEQGDLSDPKNPVMGKVFAPSPKLSFNIAMPAERRLSIA